MAHVFKFQSLIFYFCKAAIKLQNIIENLHYSYCQNKKKMSKLTRSGIILCLAFQIFNLKSVYSDKKTKICKVCQKPAVINTRPCHHNLCVVCAERTERIDECFFCGSKVYGYEVLYDDGLCVHCKEESSSVTMIPCFHKIGNVCFNQLEFEGLKHCPKCSTFIARSLNREKMSTIEGCSKCKSEFTKIIMQPCQDRIGKKCFDNHQNSETCPHCNNTVIKPTSNDRGECVVCREEKFLSVTLIPCLHTVCNLCANIAMLKGTKKCPSCSFELLQFQNIDFLKRCVCKNELAKVIVKPCNHEVGINCAEESSEVIWGSPKCPECSEPVTYFDIDDGTLKRKLNTE